LRGPCSSGGRLLELAAVVLLVLVVPRVLARSSLGRQSCGPRCLVFSARCLGYKADLGEAAHWSGTDEREGTSFAGLMRAANGIGLEARAYRLGLQHLSRITPQCPGIAYVDGDHFVVVWTDRAGSLHWIDPPFEDRLISHVAFGRRWGGAILVVSRPGEQPRWPSPARWIAGALFLLAAALGGWDIGEALARRSRSASAGAPAA
jgi:ABC-type bacteriocin/lantibiotic exporter with double-glycine peptidase domain